MDIDDILDVGVEIMDTVSDAVKNKDYSQLSSRIKQTSSPIVQEIIKNRSASPSETINKNTSPSKQQNPPQYNAVLKMPGYKTPFLSKRISRNYGLGGIVTGIAGLFFCIPSTIILAMGAMITGLVEIYIPSAFFLAGSGFSVWLISKGKEKRRLSNLYNNYGRVMGNRQYIILDELASLSGRRTDLVIDDIKKMMSTGMLPQAYLDSNNTTLMLTPEVYRQYQIALERKNAMIAENQRRMDDLNSLALSEETRKLLLEGENYLRMVKRNNELIKNETMSAKLSQLENIIDKIFSQVKKQPDSAANLRKFMNYYLPTTEKLLNAYIEVDKHPDTGENIRKTKTEIEDAVDTINEAFENLFDSLFEETAWDISSDISVMKTMLAQDGLTES